MADILLDEYQGFAVGLKLQLQFSTTAPRLSSIVVGYRKGRYVIVARPKTEKLIGFTDTYFNDAPVIVRFSLEGAVLGFRSQVNYICKHPDRLFFLQYPAEVEQFSLRSNQRVDCFFPGRLAVDKLACDIAILDISADGCRGLANMNDRVLTDHLLSGKQPMATVCFALPGSDTPIEFPCSIMRVTKEKQHLMIGMKFGQIIPDVMTGIQHYIELAE